MRRGPSICSSVIFESMILCSDLSCWNPDVGHCGSNGSGITTGIPRKSAFLSYALSLKIWKIIMFSFVKSTPAKYGMCALHCPKTYPKLHSLLFFKITLQKYILTVTGM